MRVSLSNKQNKQVRLVHLLLTFSYSCVCVVSADVSKNIYAYGLHLRTKYLEIWKKNELEKGLRIDMTGASCAEGSITMNECC